MIASSNEKIEDVDTQPNHPDQDLETQKDDLLDFINDQDQTKDQLNHMSQTTRHIEIAIHHLEKLMPKLPIMLLKLAKLSMDLY